MKMQREEAGEETTTYKTKTLDISARGNFAADCGVKANDEASAIKNMPVCLC